MNISVWRVLWKTQRIAKLTVANLTLETLYFVNRRQLMDRRKFKWRPRDAKGSKWVRFATRSSDF